MNTLEEVRQMCHIEDGHWTWKGSLSGGRPNIKAPDYTANGGKNRTQRAPRAVWHIKTGKPIPQGIRVFVCCGNPLCVNPAHLKCKTMKDWGKEITASGAWKGDPRKIAANRVKNMRRSNVTPEKMQIVLASSKPSPELARELEIPTSAISRIRRGCFVSLPTNNPWAGLTG